MPPQERPEMIVLTVDSFNGRPTESRSASFDELGGTIGRSETNQLVLPDPERSVSRVHARVLFRGGGFAIVDQGSNPISLNGRPLGSGREAPLRPGDRLDIGGFGLSVSAAHVPAQPADPFRDTFSDLFDGAPSAPSAPAAARPAQAARAPSGARSAIPEDWDPFESRESPAAERDEGPLLPAPAAEESIDALFGLQAGQGPDPFDPDPAGHRTPAPRPDNVSELNTPFPAPRRQQPGPVLSWQEEQAGGPRMEARTMSAEPVAATAQVAVPRGDGPSAPADLPRPARPVPRQEAADPGEDGRIRALLDGLGLADGDPDALDAARLEVLGGLLREALQGTVQLLQARAAFKRELRASVTTISPRENNPLKFSPDADAALTHLLRPGSPGFMKPEDAMRDAYDDLRAHQLAVMAGMRAALEGLLQRFSPQELEKRITERSRLSSLLPSGRKAQLWEHFSELYGNLSREAEDGFYELFGTHFLKAYEAEVLQLRQKGEADPRC